MKGHNMKPSDRLERILKSLDKLNKEACEAANSAEGLNAKVELHRFAKTLANTRYALRLHVFDAQDCDKLVGEA